MKLTGFKFENVFQHESLEYEIKGSLIGIIGPNGAGKSNILNGLRFGLGGDVPGKTKDKLLRWGALEGGVTVNFTHTGSEGQTLAGTVFRSVSSNKASLKIGTSVDVTGINKVGEAMATHVGIDKDILDAVFVAQAELDSVLFEQASKREVAFQRLCGLGNTQKIHKTLGQILVQAFPPQPQYDGPIAVAEAELQALKDRGAQIQTDEMTLGVLLSKYPADVRLQEDQIRARQAMQSAARLLQLEGQIAALNVNCAQYAQNLKDILTQTEGIDLANVDARIAQTRDALTKTQHLQRLYATWLTQNTALNGLTPPPVTTEALETMRAALAANQAALQAAQAQREQYAQVRKHRVTLRNLVAPNVTQESLAQVKSMLTEMQQALANARANRDLYSQLQTAIANPALTTADCPLCGSAIADLNAVRARLRERLAELAITLAKQPVYDQTAQNYETSAAQLARYQTQREQLDQLVKDAEAVLARTTQAVPDDAQLEARLAELDKIIGGADDIARRMRELDAAVVQVTRYQTQKESLDKAVRDAELALTKEALSVAAGPQLTAEAANLQTQLDGMAAVRKDLERLFTLQTQYKTSLDMATDQLNAARAEHQRINSAEILPFYPADLSAQSVAERARLQLELADRQITEVATYRTKLATIHGQRDELVAVLGTAERNLDKLRKLRDQQDAYRTVTATLERVRDWFHYGNGPHTVAVSVMTELTANVNSFLERLNAPYRVITEQSDLSYRCVFIDGRPAPPDGPLEAADLSGGEKMMLAISFRLASYCMFANKQGILVLDEPTVYLDSKNITNFCNLLGRIKEVAQSLNLQLIISTHERETLPFFDTVIDLGSTEAA